jgi:DNA-binding PadR family transcriptional regulator
MRDSPARYAVLGLLVERPAHPYDVALRFGRRVGPPWTMYRAQVYQWVDRLERDGLVERIAGPASERSKKVVYRATASGRKQFESWLTSDVGADPSPVRNALFIRLAFLRPEHAPQLLEVVAQRERAVLGRISEYASASPEVEFGGSEEWAEIGLHLILEGSVASLQAELRWLRRVREALESIAPTSRKP